MIHLDTSFLVDYLRETARGKPGAAAACLQDMPGDEEVAISLFVLCELYAGAGLSKRPDKETQKIQQIRSHVTVIFPDEGFAETYGRLLADLTRAGARVAVMDLLIATTAIVADAMLVTRNTKDFSRISGLKLLDY